MFLYFLLDLAVAFLKVHLVIKVTKFIAKSLRSPKKDLPIIKQMKTDGISYRKIAKKFNVDHHTIWNVINEISWIRHI